MVHSPPKSYRSWENQSYFRLHLLLQVTGRSMRWRRRFGGLRKETRSLVSAGPTHILDERQPCQAKAEGRRRGTVRTESEPDLHSACRVQPLPGSPSTFRKSQPFLSAPFIHATICRSRRTSHQTRTLIWGSVSLVAQMVKNLLAGQEIWVWFLGQEYPLEKGTATHSCLDRGA